MCIRDSVADGDADLDLVADVLADGKSSRLYKNMVYERRIATDVIAAQQSHELSGFFQLIATAAPGHTLAELEAAASSSASVCPGAAVAISWKKPESSCDCCAAITSVAMRRS